MRPSTFSDEAVIEAGHQLLAAGSEVTGWKIREVLGGGKPARYQKIWDERPQGAAAPLSAELPDELRNGIDSIMKTMGGQLTAMFASIYQSLVHEADVRVKQSAAALDVAQEKYNQELGRASLELDRLEALIVDHEAVASANASSLAQATADLQTANIELAQCREKIATADAALLQLQSDSNELRDALNASGTQLTTQAGLLAAAEQQCVDLKSFLADKTSELNEARRHEQAAREREAINAGQVSVLEKERLNDASVTQKVRHELQSTSNTLASTRTELASVNAQLQEKCAEVEIVKAEVEKVKAELLIAKAPKPESTKPAEKKPKA